MGYGTNTTSVTFSVADIYGSSSPFIPAGYEQIAFKVPQPGELYLSQSDGTIKTMSASARAKLPKIVVKLALTTRTLLFEIVRRNSVPKSDEIGYDPRTGNKIAGAKAYDSWPEVLKIR